MLTDWDSFFLNRLLNFMGVGLSLYGLAALYQYVSRDPIIKHMVKCRYCRKRINEKVSGNPPYVSREVLWADAREALRCVNCGSWQDGREDLPAAVSWPEGQERPAAQ
jgi:large conductance mechanosensitive channel